MIKIGLQISLLCVFTTVFFMDISGQEFVGESRNESFKSHSIASLSIPISPQLRWQNFKEETINQLRSIPGWCSKDKALLMMDLVKEHEFQTCVEIGVFGGASLFPIAKALHYKGSGVIWGIDAWDPEVAIKGLNPVTQKNDYDWWRELDLSHFYALTCNLINMNDFWGNCKLVRMQAAYALDLFEDESIDFIHFDGNHTDPYAYQDIAEYFPKVKDGGYILLNDAFWLSLRQSLVFLLERTDAITEVHPSRSFILFRKNKERLQSANELFLNDVEKD